jgi:hypothetical protein
MNGKKLNAACFITAILIWVIFGMAWDSIAAQTIYFTEGFEDTIFPARGWYDGTYTASAITASGKGAGSGLEKLVLKDKLSQKLIFQDFTPIP